MQEFFHAYAGHQQETFSTARKEIMQTLLIQLIEVDISIVVHTLNEGTRYDINTLRTGLLNCLNAHSRGLTFRHRASCI